MSKVCKLEGHALFIKRESPAIAVETATEGDVEYRRIKGFASNRGVDRQGDDIDPTLFDVESFMKNPQLFVNHRTWIREDGNEVPAGIIEAATVAQAIAGESPDELRIVHYPVVEGKYDVIDVVPNDDRGIVSEGDVGLWVVAKIMEKGVIELVDDGRLNAFSWRGQMLYDNSVGSEHIDLKEISTVYIPANAKSLFMVTKTFEETETEELVALTQSGSFELLFAWPENLKTESVFSAPPFLVLCKDAEPVFCNSYEDARVRARVTFSVTPDLPSVAVMKNTDVFTEDGEAIYMLEESYRREEASKAEWSTSYINRLPDSAFAYVESGKKDDEGKTVPRSLRHFPIRNAEGNLDRAHVLNALSRLSQSPHGPKAKSKVLAAARQLGIKVNSDKKSDSVGLTDEERHLLDGTDSGGATEGGEEEMPDPVTKEEVDALKSDLDMLHESVKQLVDLLMAKTKDAEEVKSEEESSEDTKAEDDEKADESTDSEESSEEQPTPDTPSDEEKAADEKDDGTYEAFKDVTQGISDIKGVLEKFDMRLAKVEKLPVPKKDVSRDPDLSSEERSKGLTDEERTKALDSVWGDILTPTTVRARR